MNYDIVSWSSAKQEFGLNQSLDGPVLNTTPDKIWGESEVNKLNVVVFRGDATLDSLVFLEHTFPEYDLNCIIVAGDLNITGMLDLDSNGSLPCMIYVKGNLTADSIFICSFVELLVDGDITAKRAFVAKENTGGNITVGGNLISPHSLVCYFNCLILGHIENELYVQDGWGEDYCVTSRKTWADESPNKHLDKIRLIDERFNIDYSDEENLDAIPPEEERRILVDELYNDRGDGFIDNIRQRLAEGQPIFKKGVK